MQFNIVNNTIKICFTFSTSGQTGVRVCVYMYVVVSRELGLDELLRHCECVVEKLRHPEMEPCYQAMAGTALFTHTAFDMLQNYSRYCTQPAQAQKTVLLQS